MEVLFVTLISVFVFIIALLAAIVTSLPVPTWSLLWSVLNEPSPTLEPKPKTKKKGIDIRC
jgi:hypothetical protein